MAWELDEKGIHMKAASLCKRCMKRFVCETKRALVVTINQTIKEMKHGNGKLIVVECSVHDDEANHWP